MPRWMAAWLAAAALLPGSSLAADDAAARKVFDEATQAATSGPADVPLSGQGVLELPAGQSFVPQPHATRLLNAMGNPGRDPSLQGLVIPKGDAGWFVTVRYIDAGYINDDDARDWNADELLKSIREGTEAANAERAKMGVPAVEVLGWAEKPAYDAASHRLMKTPTP